jgi:hypothetical protein
MTYAGGDYVGADGQSYPEIAARAVASIHAQTPSPIYGYLRTGIQQKIYLFPEIEQARGWFTVLLHAQQPYDYAAVFAATDLTRPVADLESFGHTHVSGDAYVGNWWPFFLGLPLGGLAGYFLRRWQEPVGARGQVVPFRDVVRPFLPGPLAPAPVPGPAPKAPGPKTAGDLYVGAPWLDIAGQDYGPAVGGPWLDIAGQDYGPAVGGPWLDIEPMVGGPWLDVVGRDIEEIQRAAAKFKGTMLNALRRQAEHAAASAGRASVVGVRVDGHGQQIVTPFAAIEEGAAWFAASTRQGAPGSALRVRPLGTDRYVAFLEPLPTGPIFLGEAMSEVVETDLRTRTAGDVIGGPWLDIEGPPMVGGPWLDIAGQDYGDPYVGGPWLDIAGQDYGYDPAVGGPWLDLVGQDYGYDPAVGGPWLDIVGRGGQDIQAVGGPWLDIVGAQADDAARRGAWSLTRALIQSAIDEVKSHAASYPAEAYVWTLDAPTRSSYPGRAPDSIVTLEGTTNIVPFSSQHEALKYLREVAQTRPVALSMFERSSPHWPNPTAWRKSDEPEHVAIVLNYLGVKPKGRPLAGPPPSETRASGDYYVGAWDTAIGSALDDVRSRAKTLADKRAGNVIGVIHMSKDGLWHTLAFRSSDDADDWLGTATHDPSAYTYAAYFDKEDYSWPHPVNEKIGGTRTPTLPGAPISRKITTTTRGDGVGDDIGDDIGDVIGDIIGAVLDDYRAAAKKWASMTEAPNSKAVGAILLPNGWSTFSFGSLDAAIDWLQRSTHDKASFTYAAAFDKGDYGTAYFQAEEIGGARAPSQPGPPIPREIATTSGEATRRRCSAWHVPEVGEQGELTGRYVLYDPTRIRVDPHLSQKYSGDPVFFFAYKGHGAFLFYPGDSLTIQEGVLKGHRFSFLWVTESGDEGYSGPVSYAASPQIDTRAPAKTSGEWWP